MRLGIGRWARASAFAVALLSLAPAVLAQDLDPCVDVALVLAVDGSGSVDNREYRFQQQAIARSFRDPEVLAALRGAGIVSVAVVFWGDASRPVHHTEAVTIRDASDADRFSRSVENLPRWTLGNTGLGVGLTAALDRLATMGCAHRSIINVSGDGTETNVPRQRRQTARAGQARDRARSMNVTINALVISGAERGLAAYYTRKVITGPGAFVMEIADYEDYAVALKTKLIREITPDILSHAD
jgi:hypothetical protein